MDLAKSSRACDPALVRTRLLLLVPIVVAAFAFAGAAPSAPPRGATALCRDGTYSFSKHHSGTCSYHGGVAKWLDGSSSTGAKARIEVGQTVLLASRTATRGCRLGPHPDPRGSPGARSS